MSLHPEIHADLEQIAHRRAESEDAMLRGMSEEERDAYWKDQRRWDELMEADTGTLQNMIELSRDLDT